MPNEIKDKVVVITGASSGLGAEAARHLARAGARAGARRARRLDRLTALADELGLAKDAVAQTDVTDRAQVKALVDRAVKLHGRIDVIINNAGGAASAPLRLGSRRCRRSGEMWSHVTARAAADGKMWSHFVFLVYGRIPAGRRSGEHA